MNVGGAWLEPVRERPGLRPGLLPDLGKEKVKLELEDPAAGVDWPGVEDTIGVLRYWNGRRMFINADSACVADSCWAWSRKKR